MNAPQTLSAEAAAAQHNAMLAWMQAMAPYGIFTTDRDLKIQSWNQWLVAHSGLDSDEMIGRSLFDAFPTLRTRRLDEHFRRALAGEVHVLSSALHRYLLPLRATVRDGVETQMLQTVRIAPLLLDANIVGTIATIEDVTQRESQATILRKQQERDHLLSSALASLLSSENPLQAATELFPRLAVPLKLEVYFHFLLSVDGTELRLHAAGGVTPEIRKAMSVLPLNEGPCGLVATQRKPVLLSHVQESSAPHAQVIKKMGLRVYAGFPLTLGERLLGTLSFGSYAHDTISAEDVEFLGTIAQYVAIAIERALRENALRQAQQSLSEHAEHLETTIAHRTAKLHETIAQLESFSYTVAHDLRAPIRSLKGYSEIMLDDYAASVPEDGKAILRRIQRAADRLDALTRDLLLFSKIERQDVKLTSVDVDELVQDIVGTTPALQGNLLVEGSLGNVVAQRTLLQQCLSNLFDNALKFATPSQPPRIVVRTETFSPANRPHPPSTTDSTAGAAFSPSIIHSHPAEDAFPPRPDSKAPFSDSGALRRRIWIEDNGIGIPPEAHHKIFGIFERVSGLDHVEGTGIGLAIVARAVQQMGGACGVESEVGRGSRFWLELATSGEAAPIART